MSYRTPQQRKWLTIFIVLIVVTSLGGLFTLPKINKPPKEQVTNPDTEVPCLLPNLPLAQHIHQMLTIVIDGTDVPVPADIGVETACHRELHTHDETGQIHIEAQTTKQYRLKDFFNVWGKPFSGNQIFDKATDAGHILVMTVNGQPSSEYENLILLDNQEIKIEYFAVMQEQQQQPEVSPEILEQLKQQVQQKQLNEQKPLPDSQ